MWPEDIYLRTVLIALGIFIFFVILVTVTRKKKDTSYPMLDTYDKAKIASGVHPEYTLDKRTGRVRLIWDRQKYLLPEGGYARDHYPLTDGEYALKLSADAEEKRKVQEEEKALWRAEMKVKLDAAKAEGHDVCYACLTIDPLRCYYCKTKCMKCEQLSGDTCNDCDSD
jgi:hypothetical protein